MKALALRMAEQRAQAENPTQDTKRPAPSGDEPLDLSEPEDWGEASKQLKREQQQEPEPEPALEWNPWDPADPMNLAMGGGQSQGYGFGL